MKKIRVFLVVLILLMAMAGPASAFGRLDLDYSLYMNDGVWDTDVNPRLVGVEASFNKDVYLASLKYFGGFYGGPGNEEGFYRFVGATMGYTFFQNEKNYLAGILGYAETTWETHHAAKAEGLLLGLQGQLGIGERFLISGRYLLSYNADGRYDRVDNDDAEINLAEFQGSYFFNENWGATMTYRWARMRLLDSDINEILSSISTGVSYSF